MTQPLDEMTPIGTPGEARENEPALASQWSYVLVVDDQTVVRDFLQRCLQDLGYAVKQADSALEALDTMTARPASLVLCDVKMPVHDGLWLTAQLRARWPETPVVMITALDDHETIAKSRALGAFDYLTKPIAPRQLLDVVRRAIAAPHDPVGMLAGRDSASAAPADEELAEGAASSPQKELQAQLGKIDAEYSLESPVRCPTCGETVSTVKAVRLLRSHVNFTSTLPRRGRLVVCPICLAVIPAELSNF